MFLGINMFWARLRALRRAQNIFMPKNINYITIIITLEGIKKIKKKKQQQQQQQNSVNNHASVYKLNGFYFPSMKIHHRTKLARNYKILPFEIFSKIVKDMKVKSEQSLFVSVEINCTIAKLTFTFHWFISSG